MIKKVLLLSVSVFIILNSYSQNHPKPVNSDTVNFSTHYSGMNNFFNNKLKNMLTDDNYRFELYSITNDTANVRPGKPIKWRFVTDFIQDFSPNDFNKVQIGVGVNLITSDKFNLYPGLHLGAGKNIKANIGGDIEGEWKFSNTAVFTGLALSYENLDNPVRSDKTALFQIFVGGRQYFKVPDYDLFLQIKGGANFWSGLDPDLNINEPVWFLGMGAGIKPKLSFTKVGEPELMPIETEVLYSPTHDAFYTKITQPVKILNSLSIGFNGMLGTHNFDSELFGFGADLCFYGDHLNSYINPYLGYKWISFGGNNNYNAHFVNLGNKTKLGKKSKWYTTFYAGIPFGASKDLNFIENFEFGFGVGYKFEKPEGKKKRQYKAIYKVYDDKDKENIGTKPVIDPLNIEEVADTLIEERVFVRSKIEKDVIEIKEIHFPNLDVSDVKFFRVSLSSGIKMDRFNPGLYENVNDYNDSQDLIIAMFNKHTSDLEALNNINMYLHFNDLDNSRYFGYRYDNNRQLQPELEIKKVGDNHLQIDENVGQVYYGYHGDFVKKLDWVDKLNDKETKKIFHSTLPLSGSFYQAQILDNIRLGNSTIDNNRISGPVVDTIGFNASNYRLAYAVFPSYILSSIKSVCDNFGVSVLFRKDLDNDYKTIDDPEDHAIGHFTEDGFIDLEDGAFFSNVVNGDQIYDPKDDPCNQIIELDGFKLGSYEILKSHLKKIQEAVDNAQNCEMTVFIGFTDSVEFNNTTGTMEKFIKDFSGSNRDFFIKNMEEKYNEIVDEWKAAGQNISKKQNDAICQRTLAFRRIYAVIKEMKDRYNLNPKDINTSPVGIWPNSKNRNNPKARRVEIRFSQIQ